MIRSTFFALFLAICFVGLHAQDICESPTILNWQEGASLELISNGDTQLYPGNTDIRATFVNQRQGGLKFHTQVGFGTPANVEDIECPGFVYYDITEDVRRSGEGYEDSLMVILDTFDNLGESTGTFSFNVIYDDQCDLKRSAPEAYYTIASVAATAEENVFSLSGRGNYFFSGNNVIVCLDIQCKTNQIIQVEGKINAAFENLESLLVLSVNGNTLIISKVDNLRVISSESVELSGSLESQWFFLSEFTFIGVVAGDLSIVNIDGTVTKVETVENAEVKVDNQLTHTFVAVQTEENLLNYVCKGSVCKKVAKSPFSNKIWDMDVARGKDTVFSFVSGDEITVVSCDRFDCKEPQVSVIKAPGVVTNIEVSIEKKEPTIIYSLANGASGVFHCFDLTCSAASLTRVHDYLSSPNFSSLRTSQSTVLFANDKVQSFNTLYASPHNELCRPTIAGNHAVIDGEVFVCNALPTVENYVPTFYWAPVVSSVFAQNL